MMVNDTHCKNDYISKCKYLHRTGKLVEGKDYIRGFFNNHINQWFSKITVQPIDYFAYNLWTFF